MQSSTVTRAIGSPLLYELCANLEGYVFRAPKKRKCEVLGLGGLTALCYALSLGIGARLLKVIALFDCENGPGSGRQRRFGGAGDYFEKP